MSKLYDDYDKVRQKRYESQPKFWELVSTLGISEENQVALEKAFETHQFICLKLGKLSNELGHDED